MAGKAAKSSIPSASTNKDLSCLRCRKKKAKCSKTRPQCTRCARSNQPCEYPDAPPNLTDLSQKVLTLYDTLRELEGEFLVKYMPAMNNDFDNSEENIVDNMPNQDFDSHEHKQQKVEDISTQEPGGWSMSLTPAGLSIHAVTRNFNEFNEFAKSISHQIMRDFGSNYLPKNWDPDAEGYFEGSEIDDELDEDEYLVTVPVISICSLFHHETKEKNRHEIKDELIQSHYVDMLRHLQQRLEPLKESKTKLPHHLLVLIKQLYVYLPETHSSVVDPLTQVCILTAYVVSMTMLPMIPNEDRPPLGDSVWHKCSEHATMLLIDLILLKGDQVHSTYPIALCAVLLGWIDTEQMGFKADRLIHLAIRFICGSNWQNEVSRWKILMATLLYLDVYSATFRFKKPQLIGEEILKVVVKMGESANDQETGILLEAKLMLLLSKVLALFYEMEEIENNNHVRKIDVDEVLTLVRDIEIWEQELPEWAKWNYELKENEKACRLDLKMHMHMIHNMVKILLFRPFSMNVNNEEQTYTKTIFLDMSTNSADRLTECLCHVQRSGYWALSASRLVRDVSERVLTMFNSDEDIVHQLNVIQKKLEKAEAIKYSAM